MRIRNTSHSHPTRLKKDLSMTETGASFNHTIINSNRNNSFFSNQPEENPVQLQFKFQRKNSKSNIFTCQKIKNRLSSIH